MKVIETIDNIDFIYEKEKIIMNRSLIFRNKKLKDGNDNEK